MTATVVDVSGPRRADDRIGDWGLSYTGRQFWPRDPRPEDVCIEDIAHALSQICRFGGHSIVPYSVAQHSVIVSEVCADDGAGVPRFMVDRLALIGLLHDATEAYLGDIIRPIKHELSGYKGMEARWANAIGHAFGLEADLERMPREIKRADLIVCATERRDVMNPAGPVWSTEVPPLPLVISPWSAALAEQRFLDRFRMLTGARP